MLKGLNDLSKKVHKNNCEKGFYDNKTEIGTKLMLCVSELGEAMEADRKGRKANFKEIVNLEKEGINWNNSPTILKDNFDCYIKDSFEDEISDTMIRLLDLCGHLNIDIEKHIYHKLEYNKQRPYLHDKNY